MDDMNEPAAFAMQTPFVLEGAKNVLCDVVKRAEDGSNSIVLRMHEHLGGWARPTLKLSVAARLWSDSEADCSGM